MLIKIGPCVQHFKILLSMLFLGALGLLLYCGVSKSGGDITFVERVIRFQFEVSNVSNDFIEENHFRFLVPAELSDRQTMLNIKSDYDISVLSGDGRKRYAKVDLGAMAPRSIKIVVVDVRVAVADGAIKDRVNKELYLADARYAESNSKEIRMIADEFALKSPQSVFKWGAANIAKDDYQPEPKGAIAAVSSRSGDCTEHMFTFIALARSLEIPSRGLAGFVIEGDVGLVSASEYHNWAEYYDHGAWRIADTFFEVLDESYSKYVIFDMPDGSGKQSFVTASDSLEVRL